MADGEPDPENKWTLDWVSGTPVVELSLNTPGQFVVEETFHRVCFGPGPVTSIQPEMHTQTR